MLKDVCVSVSVCLCKILAVIFLRLAQEISLTSFENVPGSGTGQKVLPPDYNYVTISHGSEDRIQSSWAWAFTAKEKCV